MTFGVDYAGVDGNRPPIWSMFLTAGGSMAWLRASYAYHDPAHQAYVITHDPAFARDWAGIPSTITRGAYMFPVLQASQTPEEQVATFAAAVHASGGLRRGVDFPPCLDVEFPQGIIGTGLDRPGVLAWLRRAVAALRAAFGCWPMIYTSGRVWNDSDADCLDNPPAPDLVSCPLWLARYPYKTRIPAVIPPIAIPKLAVPTPWRDQFVAWQCQGDALGCPGFTSTTDIDEWRTAKLGDKGGHVAWLQAKLMVAADGDFGPKTNAALVAFQTSRQIPVTGVLDPRTFCALAWP